MNVIMQEVILTLQLLITYKHWFLLRLTHISLAIQTNIASQEKLLVSVNKN